MPSILLNLTEDTLRWVALYCRPDRVRVAEIAWFLSGEPLQHEVAAARYDLLA